MPILTLTQPIINPIAAFDATQTHTIEFTVIGGDQVVANRLLIRNNETGATVYNNVQSTMNLSHTIPANTLTNGVYYSAVVYTLNNAGTESSPSVAVAFYCYTSPTLEITNIPTSTTIENNTYTFTGNYSQVENELLDSYQFTLYNSNKETISQSGLIYYATDDSLSYVFRGMSNDTSYYVELSGTTVNNTILTTGLLFFTVRFQQPASFSIVDLVNNCENGYIQISSNIIVIDGNSNPSPPVYINNDEVDLTENGTYVNWNKGFNISDDFTMRIWGRNFNDNEIIVEMENELNSINIPNKIEMKWMTTMVEEQSPTHSNFDTENATISDSVSGTLKITNIDGQSIQNSSPSFSENKEIYSVGDTVNLFDNNLANYPNLEISHCTFELIDGKITLTATGDDTSFGISIAVGISYSGSRYGQKIEVEPDTIYTFSVTNPLFTWNRITEIDANNTSLVEHENIGTTYTILTNSNTKYVILFVGYRNSVAGEIYSLNVQFEKGDKATSYVPYNYYRINPTVATKNLFNFDDVLYVDAMNCTLTVNKAYYFTLDTTGVDSYATIGIRNIFTPGETYNISFEQEGNFSSFALYSTNKLSSTRVESLATAQGNFVAPDVLYDLALVFTVDNSTADNYLNIWNIQIEKGENKTSYEVQQENYTNVILNEPLRGIGDFKDKIYLENINLLNPDTSSAIVQENTSYYFSTESVINTYVYIWFYDKDNNIINYSTDNTFLYIYSGRFTTPENCTKIVLTSSQTETSTIQAALLIGWNARIVKGENKQVYYPYIDNPTIARYFESKTLNEDLTWSLYTAGSNQTNTLMFFTPDSQMWAENFTLDSEIVNCMAQELPCYTFSYLNSTDTEGIAQFAEGIYVRILKSRNVSNLSTFLTFIESNPIHGFFRLYKPTVENLDENNISALSGLTTYSPISNVFTNNTVPAVVGGGCPNGEITVYDEDKVYVLLRCWGGHDIPYIIHSNSIDMPESKDKIFIWVRRKNNIFDLKIENLYGYNEATKEKDTTKPTVTLEIDESAITKDTIPVTAHAVDNTQLRTIRFSQDNGVSWIQTQTVDSPSTTQSYTFADLAANTIYAIRVEAIDMWGNMGHITQQVKTLSS